MHDVARAAKGPRYRHAARGQWRFQVSAALKHEQFDLKPARPEFGKDLCEVSFRAAGGQPVADYNNARRNLPVSRLP
jgi:hypothetical protein